MTVITQWLFFSLHADAQPRIWLRKWNNQAAPLDVCGTLPFSVPTTAGFILTSHTMRKHSMILLMSCDFMWFYFLKRQVSWPWRNRHAWISPILQLGHGLHAQVVAFCFDYPSVFRHCDASRFDTERQLMRPRLFTSHFFVPLFPQHISKSRCRFMLQRSIKVQDLGSSGALERKVVLCRILGFLSWHY